MPQQFCHLRQPAVLPPPRRPPAPGIPSHLGGAPPGTAEEERDTCPFSRPWGPDKWMGDKVTAARLHAEVKVFGDCQLPFKYEVPHRFYCPTHPSCILERGKDFTRFDSFLSWCVLLTRATKFSFLIFCFFQITEKNTRLSRV